MTTLTSPTQSQGQEATSQPTRMLVDANLQTHWIAETFSLTASLTDYESIAQSIIQDRRIVDPIVLYEGGILDGRVRYDIAKEHGIRCWAVNFEQTDEGIAAGGKEALDRAARDYLLQKNVVRRHYTQGQRAAIAAQLATMSQGARTDLEPSAALRNVSQPEAARLCGVSVRLLQNAQRIYREGLPADIEAMRAGTALEPIVRTIAARKKEALRKETLRLGRPMRDSAFLIEYANSDCQGFIEHSVNDRSIDLFCLDPPYYRVVKAEWDNQWATIDQYYAWCKRWIEPLGRVAKYNANLCIFGFPRQLCHLLPMIEMAGFTFRQQIVIDKGMQSVAGRTGEELKMYPTATESIFCFHYEARDYIRYLLQAELRRLGMSPTDCNILLDKASNGGGTFSSIAGESKPTEHRVYPTRNDWHQLSSVMTLPAYDEVQFAFNLTPGLTDVWRDIDFYNPKEAKFHPTQKPITLMERLIKTYSHEGHTVLDLFAGSGSSAVACKMHGRNFIGCERDKSYYEMSLARINSTEKVTASPITLAE